MNNAFSTPGSPLYFSPIDVDERIGRGLVTCIFLKYGQLDAGTYADATALRAAISRTLPNVEELATSLAHIDSLGRTVRWAVSSRATDDGDSVFRPDDRLPTDPGRWVAAPFRDWRGPFYLHCLEVVGFVDRSIPLDAPEGQPSLLTLSKGKTPAIFVSFLGKDKPEVADEEPGALLREGVNFQIRVISKNWRGSPSARYGSEIPEEAALDPGASELVGRISWLLRGSQGLYGTIPGGGYPGTLPTFTSPFSDFSRVVIGEHRAAASFGPDLRVMDSLDVSIKIATERPNEIQDLNVLDAIRMQHQQPQDDGSVVSIGPPFIIFAHPIIEDPHATA